MQTIVADIAQIQGAQIQGSQTHGAQTQRARGESARGDSTLANDTLAAAQRGRGARGHAWRGPIAGLAGALFAAVSLGAVPAAAEGWIGDDGLHKQAWMRDTFLDLGEDLEEATAEGKRMVIFFEQRGCIYCAKMHEEVFSDPEVSQFIEDNFFVVQLNLHGDREAVDLDGDVRPEKDLARKWGILFTPTVMFLPDGTPEGQTAAQSAVAVMPGAFSKGTSLDMFTWVDEKRYEMIDATGEDFQRYHARRIQERNDGNTD